MDVADQIQVPKCERSNPSAQSPPFSTLIGEHPLLISKTADGNAMVTNFRFCACERRSFINIPLMMVGELTVIEAAKRLRIGCKDGSTYSCTFATIEDCTACTALLKEKTGQPKSRKAIFAYRFYDIAMYKLSLGTPLTKLEQENIQLCQPVDLTFDHIFGKEVDRLEFDTNKRKIWRMCQANDKFELCPTYPRIHILPATVDDDKLKISLDFRAMKRFPSVVWRDKSTGMVLIRSSQPLSSFLGVSYFTNHADVFLIEEIVNACNKDWVAIVQEEQKRAERALPEPEVNNIHRQGSNSNTNSVKEDGAQGSLVCDDSSGTNDHGASNGSCYYNDGRTPKKLAIVDCRSLAGVWGNSFKGGGTEDEVVYKCNIVHLDLANIHTVRDSFNKLRALCHAYVEGTFYKSLTGCMWLTYITALLRGANIVVELMHVMRRPVLVHCSDGWDRTSQIVSLSELMMDPYYRTLEGFQMLVEREWLHFGHKFAERGGHDPSCSDTNQISPIFLQFLDCVYQLTIQHPAEFQFSEAYLIKLLQNSQSCLFGNFLHNSQRERENCQYKTASVWSLLKLKRPQFVNLLYKPSKQVLTAKISEHDIVLWKSVYMAGLSPMPHVSQMDFYHESIQTGSGEDTGNPTSDGMPRSKSMDDLSKISVDSGRRNSDPSITQSQEITTASPGTNSAHDDSLSGELVHFSEDSLHSPGKPNPSSKPDESSKDSQRKISPDISSSIKQNPSAREISSLNGDISFEMPVTDEVQENCATISLQSPPQEIVQLSPEKIYINGQHCDVQRSSECISINELSADIFLCEDSTAENLDASSSAVFCQETGSSVKSSEQTLCCDRQMNNTDSQVLSDTVTLYIDGDSSSDFNATQFRSCDIVCSKSMDSVDTISNTSLRVTSGNSSLSSGYNSKQSSLLSERLASSCDLELSQNGKVQNINYTLVNGRIGYINLDDTQHSSDLHAIVKAQVHLEGSRTLFDDCAFMDGYCNGSDRNVTQVIKSAIVEASCLNGDACLYEAQDCSDLYTINCLRATTNSVSTDTLKGDLESGDDDAIPTLAPVFPLEVSTQQHEMIATTSPSTSALALLTSSLKRNSYPSDVHEVPQSNVISRRARAASGASRDLSVSPCACRGNWSDTGRLRNPSGSEMKSRRILGATVATSTTDISDSHVGQLTSPTVDRQPSIAQHIDIDGLTLFCDERQDLLAELVAEKNRKILELEQRLKEAKSLIGRNSQQPQPPAAHLDDMATDSDGGELGSLGTMSNASDVSWEAIDESEAKIVLWVPDAAVTHCARCDRKFSLYNRKHHCRNCGKVFCAECSNFLAPVPHQHLNKPERVCGRCHSNLLQLSPGASSDGRIPTLVADG